MGHPLALGDIELAEDGSQFALLLGGEGLVYGNKFVVSWLSTSQVTLMSPGVKSVMRHRSWMVAWVLPLGSQEEW